MAKLEKNVTVTVKSGDTEVVYTAPDASISGGSTGVYGGKKILTIQLFDYENAGMTTKLKAEEPEAQEDPHTAKIQQHTGVILDVLKQVESTRLNAAIRRERLEAELADKERADRVTLRFAIFNATQAGVSEEEVVRRLRVDHFNYVSNMYDEVREHIDLDTAPKGSNLFK